ncbi:MAG: hypothetical protein C0597_12395 [Marinilabiliales bacterium]|nr:MAG: hypothetical protein C0597_12395 [Marinilabiliales bacterium]
MERKIEQLERYLTDEMSIREQVEFEELLRRDSELMQEFLLRKKINEAIQEKDIINLRDSLNDIADSNIKVKPGRSIAYTYPSVAAVVVLLIVIANVYFNPFNKLDQQEIFQSYYDTYPSINGHRSGTSAEQNVNLVSAFNYYDESNYKEAEPYFKWVLEKDQSNVSNQFYLAICLIENSKLSEAEIYLNDLILKQDHLFWEQSHWYLALVYIEQEKVEQAKAIFEKIVKEKMTYASNAKKILKSFK